MSHVLGPHAWQLLAAVVLHGPATSASGCNDILLLAKMRVHVAKISRTQRHFKCGQSFDLQDVDISNASACPAALSWASPGRSRSDVARAELPKRW